MRHAVTDFELIRYIDTASLTSSRIAARDGNEAVISARELRANGANLILGELRMRMHTREATQGQRAS
jgi:hypothetical protein